MPLKKSAGMSANIKELHKGATYKATSAKFGKKDADKQAVAIAYKVASSGAGKKHGN